jgi:hypothetical protein
MMGEVLTRPEGRALFELPPVFKKRLGKHDESCLPRLLGLCT